MSEGLDRRRLLAGIGTAGAAAGIASARAADGEAILFSTVPDLGALSALTPMTGTVAWVAGCRFRRADVGDQALPTSPGSKDLPCSRSA